jgi:hypothetical protein
MVRAAAAIAIAACFLAVPSAHAAGHALTLSDPQETSCSGGACLPDITSLAIYYDTDGTFFVSTTFAQPLPAYAVLGATRVRVNIGRGVTADGSACTPVGDAGHLTGEAGDIRIEVGAYDGGVSPSTAASGVLYRAGSAVVLATTRSISSDRRTLTVTADSPQVSGLDLRCTQADLADDVDTGAVVRDAVQLGWFPGYGPEPPIAQPGSPTPATTAGKTTTGAIPGTAPRATAGLARPVLVSAPAVSGIRKVARRLTCSSGRWTNATRFTFRWLRDGRPIARASSRHYRARKADRRHLLRCSVTAANAGGNQVAASRALRIR